MFEVGWLANVTKVWAQAQASAQAPGPGPRAQAQGPGPGPRARAKAPLAGFLDFVWEMPRPEQALATSAGGARDGGVAPTVVRVISPGIRVPKPSALANLEWFPCDDETFEEVAKLVLQPNGAAEAMALMAARGAAAKGEPVACKQELPSSASSIRPCSAGPGLGQPLTIDISDDEDVQDPFTKPTHDDIVRKYGDAQAWIYERKAMQRGRKRKAMQLPSSCRRQKGLVTP